MWYDLDIQLRKKANGDFVNMIDNDAIQNSLNNIFKTLPGSRRMLYPFASPMWGMLFEQIDEITSRRLGHLLLKSIETWENRITVDNLHVMADPDNNQYVVELTYTVITGGDTQHIYRDVIQPV